MKLEVDYNKRCNMELTWHEYLALVGLLRNAPDDGQMLKMKVRTGIVSALSKDGIIPAEGLVI